MAEISPDRARELTDVFLPVFNTEHVSNFVFDSVDTEGSDFDILCRDGEQALKIQVVESVPTRGEDLVALKRFENGKADGQAMTIQSDDLRIDESLGHKLHKYPTVDLQKDLIILIDFGLFPWRNENLSDMKTKAEQFKGAFPGVYCVHLGSGLCKHLA